MRQLIVKLGNFTRRLIGDEQGLVAIEFGAVASLLILMLIGATDLGLAARHRSQMEGAVRAGIQEALLGGTDAAVESAVSESTDLPSSPEPTVSASEVCYDADDVKIDDCADPQVAKGYMEITLEQEHEWLLGMPGLPNPMMLKIKNSVRIF
jgi:Flp pilus assembly protein TadG